MDGMSWANAAELVHSLADEQDHWAPASWRPRDHRGRPAGALPPVLASVPSLTQVSRAHFFAGRFVKDAGDEGNGKDPLRWAANRHLGKHVPEGEAPVLLLKDKVMTEQGLHPEAVRLIREREEGQTPRAVALVINAIDDQLKAGQQLRIACTADRIKPLREILVLAAQAGRAVLLIADHGHELGDRMKRQGPRGEGGHRWRPLHDGEAPRDFERRLPAGGTWKPRSAEAVAAIWDSRCCYGQPRFGEHGGLSLAEVVAPAILVAPDALFEARPGVEDEALRIQRVDEPGWWRFMPPRAIEAQPARGPRSVAPGQLELIPAPATPAPPPARSPLVERLRRSPAFKAHAADLPPAHVHQALELLGEIVLAGDQVGDEELARRANVMPYRLAGAVARLGEVLNHDGYAVVEHDLTGRQVRLNRVLLSQLFEFEG